MSRRESRKVRLPCCREIVTVTGRPAKMRERPRNHRCPKCGAAYRVDAGNRAEGA